MLLIRHDPLSSSHVCAANLHQLQAEKEMFKPLKPVAAAAAAAPSSQMSCFGSATTLAYFSSTHLTDNLQALLALLYQIEPFASTETSF